MGILLVDFFRDNNTSDDTNTGPAAIIAFSGGLDHGALPTDFDHGF
jgi:hypothetical protein